MLAFVLSDKGPTLVHDFPDPEPPPGRVRVRLRMAGVCRTDLELARGYMGFAGVLGHEFVGEALEGRLAGRRVVGGINFACGDCELCRRGLGRHCPHRTVLGIQGADGVFGEELVLPEANLLEVPEGLGDTEAVFTEPVSAACEVLEQLDRAEPGPVLVVGDGKLGPLIAQVLASEGYEVSLVGRHLEGVAWLEDRGVVLIGAEPEGGPWPLVVEASGSAEGLATAIEATEPRGTLVLKTTVAGRHEIDLSPVVINEITLLGSRCGRMEEGLARLADGRVEVGPMVAARYGLTEIDRGFEHAARPGTRKVLIEGL